MNRSKAFMEYAKRMKKMCQDDDYAYATGRLAVFEERLLSYAKLEDLARPDSPIEQLEAAMSEAGYPAAESLADRVKQGAAANDALLKEITNNGPLAKALLLQNDMHNLKVMLNHLKEEGSRERIPGTGDEAAKVEGIPSAISDLLFTEAILSVEELWFSLQKFMANPASLAGNGDYLLGYVQEEIKHWATDYRPAATDMRIDQAWFRELGKQAQEAEKLALADYLGMYRELLADLYNLQSAARLLRLRGAVNGLQDAFVSGGKVSWDEAHSAILKGVSGLSNVYRNTAAEALLEHLPAYVKGKEIYEFGRRLTELRLDFAKFGLQAGNGIPQVAGYWLARRLEAQNLRIILAGKSNRSEEKQIPSLLRDTYRRSRA